MNGPAGTDLKATWQPYPKRAGGTVKLRFSGLSGRSTRKEPLGLDQPPDGLIINQDIRWQHAVWGSCEYRMRSWNQEDEVLLYG